MAEKDDSDDKALNERLEKLRNRLDGPEGSRLADKADPNRAVKRTGGDISKALKLSSEFIAGIIVGGVLGYGFDALLGTSPWGLIVFLLLGFAAAVLNVMRAAGFVAQNEVRLKNGEQDKNKLP
ncbi:MAG: AtpZ/AtpI family protein [Pseudomonadota bacterium]